MRKTKMTHATHATHNADTWGHIAAGHEHQTLAAAQ